MRLEGDENKKKYFLDKPMYFFSWNWLQIETLPFCSWQSEPANVSSVATLLLGKACLLIRLTNKIYSRRKSWIFKSAITLQIHRTYSSYANHLTVYPYFHLRRHGTLNCSFTDSQSSNTFSHWVAKNFQEIHSILIGLYKLTLFKLFF